MTRIHHKVAIYVEATKTADLFRFLQFQAFCGLVNYVDTFFIKGNIHFCPSKKRVDNFYCIRYHRKGIYTVLHRWTTW